MTHILKVYDVCTASIKAIYPHIRFHVEKPDEKDCFHHLTCYLPTYEIEEVFGFSEKDVERYMEIIRSTSHLILEFAKDGGFENAANF